MRWLLTPLRDAGIRFVVLALFTLPLFAAMQWAMHQSGGYELLADQGAHLSVAHDGSIWAVWPLGVLVIGAIVVAGVALRWRRRERL